MASIPAELLVRVRYDTSDRKTQDEKLAAQMEARAKKLEMSLEETTRKGSARRAEVQKAAAVEREAAESSHEQRLRQMRERHEQSMLLSQEKAQAKSLRSNSSWSAQMTKNLSQLTMMVKAYAIAWATTGLARQIKQSVDFAGAMKEQADGVRVTTKEYYALQEALIEVGLSGEKIQTLFARINDMAEGGGEASAKSALSALGINTEGMQSIELFNVLLEKTNKGMVNQAQLTDLVGARSLLAFNALAAEFTSVNDIMNRYEFPLTDEQVQLLDRMGTEMRRLSVQVQLAIAEGLAKPENVANLTKFVDQMVRLSSAVPWEVIGLGMRGISIGLEGLAKNPIFAIPIAQLRLIAQITGGGDAQITGGGDAQITGGGDAQPFPLVGSGLTSGIHLSPITLPEQVITAPGQSVTAPRPVDSQGRRLRRSRPGVGEHGFDLPTISRQLPTVTNEVGSLNLALSDTANSLDLVIAKMAEILNSQAWQVASAGVSTFTAVLDFQSAALQNQVDILNQIGQMERDRWDERAERMRDAGLQTSALYRNELRDFERAERERAKKMRKLQSEGFEINKRSRIAETTMLTAQSIMNAFATAKNPVLAVIMAALAGAQGALQIASIAGQQNPYRGFAFGGLVPGGGFGDDNLVRVQGGEYVTNRAATERNRSALEYANAGGTIQPGGVSGITVIIQGDIVGDQRYVESKMIPAIQKALDKGYKLQFAR